MCSHQCAVAYYIARCALVNIEPAKMSSDVCGGTNGCQRGRVFLFLYCIFAEAKIRQKRKHPLASVINFKTTDSVEMKDLEQTSAPFLAEVGSGKLYCMSPLLIKWLTVWGTKRRLQISERVTEDAAPDSSLPLCSGTSLKSTEYYAASWSTVSLCTTHAL